MWYLHHTPWWLRALFAAGCTWQAPAQGGQVYLTFDDGPHPEATPLVLEALAAAGMQGTFFCIGKNVDRYPELYNRILAEGHAVGNHTMLHANGRHTSVEDYLLQIAQAGQRIGSNLFRPPYGQISRRQVAALRSRWPQADIVMWSVLSGDFDERKSGTYCFAQVERHLQPGGIVVFHDSTKALPRLREALPMTLQYLQSKGWQSVAMPSVSVPLV
ncbi:MAG: polysaccharide deacetylase family protein [Chitinophagaceae bacterium]|nr:polysaccharide deacetylase family protein [Chitinophagaceae bacterium]